MSLSRAARLAPVALFVYRELLCSPCPDAPARFSVLLGGDGPLGALLTDAALPWYAFPPRWKEPDRAVALLRALGTTRLARSASWVRGSARALVSCPAAVRAWARAAPGAGWETLHRLLETAVAANKEGVVRLLLAVADREGVCRVDHMPDPRWGRPSLLMLAAFHGSARATALLAGPGGADTELEDAEGQTALFYAAGRGHTHAVRALAAAGANVHHQDREGRTALFRAACGPEPFGLVRCPRDAHPPAFGHRGFRLALAQLLELGCAVDHADHEGLTALQEAARCGAPASVKVLLAAGACARHVTRAGDTAFRMVLRGLSAWTNAEARQARCDLLLQLHEGPGARADRPARVE
jgi:hypothetical protein